VNAYVLHMYRCMDIITQSADFVNSSQNVLHVQCKDLTNFFSLPTASSVTFAKYFSLFQNMHAGARAELIRICSSSFSQEYELVFGQPEPVVIGKPSAHKKKKKDVINTIQNLGGVFKKPKGVSPTVWNEQYTEVTMRVVYVQV
jgi:hypothetical protein